MGKGPSWFWWFWVPYPTTSILCVLKTYPLPCLFAGIADEEPSQPFIESLLLDFARNCSLLPQRLCSATALQVIEPISPLQSAQFVAIIGAPGCA
jgi:hypothetical protein